MQIAVVRLFPRSFRAANDETRPRPESILGERSFPARSLGAIQIPSARAPQRTTRNGSSAGLRVSPLGSNRVTCDGGEDANALRPAEILTGIPVRKDDAIPCFDEASRLLQLAQSHQDQMYATSEFRRETRLSLDDVRTQSPDPVPISTKVLINQTGNLKYPSQTGQAMGFFALSLEALLQQCRVQNAGRKRFRFEDRLQIPMLYLLYPD